MVKVDQFSAARGGTSQFIDVRCRACGTFVLVYQKDGPGPLLRMYLDRIADPEALVSLMKKTTSAENIPLLVCEHCHGRLAEGMVYEKEDRLAYRVIEGAIVTRETNVSGAVD